jgi:hypothetical protein
MSLAKAGAELKATTAKIDPMIFFIIVNLFNRSVVNKIFLTGYLQYRQLVYSEV